MKNNHLKEVPAAKVQNGNQFSNNQLTILKQTELLGKQFTVYGTIEEPLFLAKDVAEWIEYNRNSNGDFDVSQMLDTVDELEKKKIFCTISDTYNTPKPTVSANYAGANRWFLTEDGIYEVLMQSRKPIAKQFKSAVKTILKEIRRTGGYLASTTEDTPEMIMARALKVAERTIEAHAQRMQMLQAQNELQTRELKEAAPKVEYVDEVLQSVNTYTSTQMAKELGLRTAEQLHTILKDKGIMINQSGQWMLTAKYSGHGYTKPRTHPFTRNDGSTGTNTITVWTEKGRWFLHNTFVKGGKI